MTTTDSASTAIVAARALLWAGQWDLAAELLTATGDEHSRVLLAIAEVDVYRSYWRGTGGNE